MPKYTYPLKGGKTLVLEGDEQPPDSAVEAIAAKQGVSLMPKAEDNEKTVKPSEELPLGERAARAIEGKGVPGSIRAGVAGMAKGAIEQVQHPFTWGGPQTQKLISQNVPGGDVINSVLDTASPGGMVLTKAGQALAPAAAKMSAAPIASRVAQFSAEHPRISGAVKGGLAGGAYEGLTGGDIRKGVVGGAMLGAGFKGKVPGVNIRIGGMGAEAAGEGAAAAGAGAAKAGAKAAETAAPSAIKSAEEFAAMDRKMKLAAMEASRRGMMHAAGMSPSEMALMGGGK
jgi:hypothetical protein